jgi:pimeloyl-ACP methyl ester carboxylesterase
MAISVATLTSCNSGPKQKDIVVLTPDGFKLSATVYGEGTKGVVLAHDENSSKAFVAPLAFYLAQQKFVVMTFNFRGYEGSEGVPDPTLMDRDVVGAALSLTRNFGAREVSYAGFGTGALIAAKAATDQDYSPRSLVMTGLPSTYGSIEATDVLPPLFLPKLFMVPSGDDSMVAGTEELMKLAPNPKELHVYPAEENWLDPSSAVAIQGSGVARLVKFLEKEER